ncbi:MULTISPECIES: cytochrome P450 [unclassified Streptomyces]|uniref:cytochrome P450 n=1 Tax=unclassified Streptomyces TaxID=2593676 RepID=UPI001651A12A|nr:MULTISPECIES: cytochrome P450 [unclassified Streptomyces]MDQ0790229.1 cytochrome P450 [Streptomyces sp. B3I8]
MTTPQPASGRCPAHVGEAARPDRPFRPLPIYGPEFNADPHATYALLRAQGPIAPVEISPSVWGYLTTTYRSALYLLRNTPNRFAKNPRHWQALANGQVPPDSPALMMMQPRDNALWMDGHEHARFRHAITGSLARVDTHALAATVTQIADQLIDAFAPTGVCDLVAQYTDPLPMLTVIEVFGSPPEIGRRITTAIARLFDTDQDAAAANADLEYACLALTHLKRGAPQRDVTSWLIEAGLSDEEMVQTILLVIGAATTPSSNLIMNALQRIITNPLFAGSVHDGVQPVSDALDEVLWTDPPVSNYSPLYALGQQTFEGMVLQPGYPILVSFAAANGDPSLGLAPTSYAGNRGHLAFSAGVHACPAPDLARIIAETAIERALDRLPHLALATTQLIRRPGTFHSGFTALPVRFQPAAALAPTGR